MKKILFALPVIALAVFLAYCSKSDVQEVAAVNTDDVAVSRGTCTLTNTPSNIAATLTVCGTNLNAQQCQMCPPGNPKGTGVAVYVGGLINNLTLTTPIEFSISTNAQTALNLSTGANALPPIPMNAGDCRRFRIDDNCIITAL